MSETRTASGWTMTVLTALALVALATACGLVANAASPKGLPLVAPAAPAGVRHIGLDAAIDAHAAGTTFLDARVTRAYRAGHIAAAHSVPYSQRLQLEDMLRALVADDDPIVVYCTGVDCPAAGRLADWMLRNGWRNVAVFDDGYPVWRSAGLEVERGDGGGVGP
jgi:rhodanese-related sulfurtransferase